MSLAENFLPSKTFKTICGTPGFMAPEIFSNDPYDENIDDRILLSDIYELKWVRKMLSTQEITPLLPRNPTVDDYLQEYHNLIKRDFKSMLSSNNILLQMIRNIMIILPMLKSIKFKAKNFRCLFGKIIK